MTTGIVEINHMELVDAVKRHYKAKIPFVVWGEPGIGKSESIYKAAAELSKELKDEKFGLIDIRLSQMPPEDLKGLPFPDKEKKTTEWLKPNFLPTSGNGLLFLDEIGQAAPSIQSAAYQLILDRKLGDYEMPPGWCVVAASNRMEDKCHVIEMSKALQNRFSHYELMAPQIYDNKKKGQTDWTDWAIDHDINENIIFFLKFKPDFLQKFEIDDPNPSYCTARSWSKASRLIEGLTDIDELKKYIGSCVGLGAATVFTGWYKLNKEIDIDEILKHPKLAKDIKKPDLHYTLAAGLVGRYKNNPKILDRILAVCDEMPVEMCFLTIRMCMGMSKDAAKFKTTLTNLPNFEKMAEKLEFLHKE